MFLLPIFLSLFKMNSLVFINVDVSIMNIFPSDNRSIFRFNSNGNLNRKKRRIDDCKCISPLLNLYACKFIFFLLLLFRIETERERERATLTSHSTILDWMKRPAERKGRKLYNIGLIINYLNCLLNKSVFCLISLLLMFRFVSLFIHFRIYAYINEHTSTDNTWSEREREIGRKWLWMKWSALRVTVSRWTTKSDHKFNLYASGKCSWYQPSDKWRTMRTFAIDKYSSCHIFHKSKRFVMVM